MSDLDKNVIAVRVKGKPKKTYIWTIVLLVASTIISILSFVSHFILNEGSTWLYFGFIFLFLAVMCIIFIPIFLNNYKRTLRELTYPKEAIKLVDGNLEIITDKVESIKLDEIKKVVGRNLSTTTNYYFYMKRTEYNYGPMAIHLKDGRKIDLNNIDNVNQVVSVLNELKR